MILAIFALAFSSLGAPTVGVWEEDLRVVPNGWGVNLGFAPFRPEEAGLFRQLGTRWVRRDLFWHEIEKEKGKYHFEKYDQFLSDVEAMGLDAGGAQRVHEDGRDVDADVGAPREHAADAAVAARDVHDAGARRHVARHERLSRAQGPAVEEGEHAAVEARVAIDQARHASARTAAVTRRRRAVNRASAPR